ncbi:hypothetical protein C8R45DRAFT_1206661 [Mycena sanguinolenta]|nr:hypothetical protein C8R45DRAFT_1206661 [Mycena sanguinolenta]
MGSDHSFYASVTLRPRNCNKPAQYHMDSPFEKIFHTNTVPSDADCQRIRQLLARPLEKAAALTAKIECLQAQINQLGEERDHLNSFIDPHLALISPARRLPPEVVAEIFAACLPSHRNPIISGKEAPLLLSHICHEWRNIALTTPRLWASLHVIAPIEKRCQEIREAVDIWLSRSGVLPLSISLVHSTAAGLDFRAVLEAFIPYSSRWHRIRFRLPAYHNFRPLSVLSPNDVPILESAMIDGFAGADPYWDFLAFLGATSLRSVAFRRAVKYPQVPIPWSLLRHLCIDRESRWLLTAAEALDIMQRCPELETCALPFKPLWGDASPMPECRMERLRRLSVVDEWNGTAAFFNNLHAPRLESLEYITWDVKEFPFTSFLTSGAEHLQCLSFCVRKISDLAIIDCLRRIPALSELVICSRAPLEDLFWNSMIPEDCSALQVLCPRLRSITFLHFIGADTLIQRFIQARSGRRFPDIAQLSKVHVQFQSQMVVDILPDLSWAIEDGIDVSLSYPASPSQKNTPHTHAHGETTVSYERFEPGISPTVGRTYQNVDHNNLDPDKSTLVRDDKAPVVDTVSNAALLRTVIDTTSRLVMQEYVAELHLANKHVEKALRRTPQQPVSILDLDSRVYTEEDHDESITSPNFN